MKEIVILFTRVPKEGATKTRLYDFVTPKEAKIIQEKLLSEICNNLISWDIDYEVFHNGTSADDGYMQTLTGKNSFSYQEGKTLGEKMANAIASVLERYPNSKVLLIGSDIVGLKKDIFDYAFNSLDKVDIVINSNYDGGYYLVGMKDNYRNIFDISSYGDNTVFDNTIQAIENNKLSYITGEKLLDIDTKEDILYYETGFEGLELLGAGQYNINFLYNHSQDEKRILRLNMASQMNLVRQMHYEYETLKMLENSGVTPKVYYLNEKPKIIRYNYLTMEFLPGRELCYDKDMEIAAYLLSQIHKQPFKNGVLIEASQPFKLMYEECQAMANIYLSWDKADEIVKSYLEKFLGRCKTIADMPYELQNKCIINTELNSSNFLIGETKESSYVIDWEKALFGEVEQDLAHFLAPTTTYWKTDKILSEQEIESFLEEYSKYNSYNKEKFDNYFIMTCLRGVTWCSMAYKQYICQEKLMLDDVMFNKIKSYLNYDFLKLLKKYFNL